MNKRHKVVINKPTFRQESNSSKHWREIIVQVAALIAAISITWVIVTANFYHKAQGVLSSQFDSLDSVVKPTMPREPVNYSKKYEIEDKKYFPELKAKAFFITYKNQDFYVFKTALQEDALKLYWKDTSSNKIRSFGNLKNLLKQENRNLIFAMNGGIYSKDNNPIGLYIEGGVVHRPLLTDTAGYGNFFMQPNGVFAFDKEKATISTTLKFSESEYVKHYEYAIQSGPMLLIDNKINQKFAPSSSNKFTRNGVGIDKDGLLYFVISNDPVNFHEIATFFKDKLECLNALYLDGSISRIYLPALGINDLGGDFGSIIAISTSK